jgi:hypothetical protein
MFIATVILVAGKRLYVFKPPQGNITAQVCGGIWVKLTKYCKKDTLIKGRAIFHLALTK